MELVQLVPVGVGCPGARAGEAAGVAAGCEVDELAGGTVVVGCGGLSVSSPRTPSICGATVTGTSGADRLS